MNRYHMVIETWSDASRQLFLTPIEVPALSTAKLETIMSEWLQKVSRNSKNQQVTRLIPPVIVRCVGCLEGIPLGHQPSPEALESFLCPDCTGAPERIKVIGTILEVEYMGRNRDLARGSETDCFHLHLNKDKINSWQTRGPARHGSPYRVGERIDIFIWPTGYSEVRIEMPKTDKEFFEAAKESMEEGLEALREGKPLRTTVVEETQEEDSKE